MISSHFLMTMTRFQNLAFFHFSFFPKFYTSSILYFSSPKFFLPPFSWTESTHNIRKMKNRAWFKKNKMNQNKTLRVSSHFMDEDSYVQFEKPKSNNETMKLTFYFFLCCVVFLFSCNKWKSPSWFLSCRLTDGTNGFAG